MEDLASLVQQIRSLHNIIKPNAVKLSDLSRKDESISLEARKKGNDLYTQKNKHTGDTHRNILLQYSKSIAYAPVDSECLALAYNNRSVLLLHVQRYKECLVDIENSMQITKCNVLKAKLKSRKKKCLGFIKKTSPVWTKKEMTKQNKFDQSPGIYEMKPSSQMPVASEAISASYNETFGRHLVATRDIKAGEVVLVERGLAFLPQHSQTYLVCNHCLRFAWNGIPCDMCALGVYCSEECKKEASEEYHDMECSLLPFLSFVMYDEIGFQNSLVLACRMLIKAIKKEGLDTILMESKTDRKGLEGMITNGAVQQNEFKNFYNLLSHEQPLKKRLDRKIVNEVEVIQLLSKHTNIFDSAKVRSDKRQVILQLVKILGKLVDILTVNAFGYYGSMCNCHTFGKSTCECDSIKGMYVATCASLLNHSCAPNVSRINIPKGKIVIFTLTPVKKGEQLCDSYGPTIGMPKNSRTEYLQKNFFFTCSCRCCEEDWDGKQHNISEIADQIISKQIINEFKRSFTISSESSLFTDQFTNWNFDEKQLKMASKMTDLIYEYWKNPLTALMESLHYRLYIDMAFNNLYGENASLPNNC